MIVIYIKIYVKNKLQLCIIDISYNVHIKKESDTISHRIFHYQYDAADRFGTISVL